MKPPIVIRRVGPRRRKQPSHGTERARQETCQGRTGVQDPLWFLGIQFDYCIIEGDQDRLLPGGMNTLGWLQVMVSHLSRPTAHDSRTLALRTSAAGTRHLTLLSAPPTALSITQRAPNLTTKLTSGLPNVKASGGLHLNVTASKKKKKKRKRLQCGLRISGITHRLAPISSSTGQIHRRISSPTPCHRALAEKCSVPVWARAALLPVFISAKASVLLCFQDRLGPPS
ncbi:hypothetical protein LZ31DRAFT_375459 [Colletotrichum somersetense]|nr:hypothetical protein LZ31DRAFT_375459 [Colletotrichum somersetense]